DELEASCRVAILKPDEDRDFLAARRAPRRPEIHDQNLAGPLPERLRLTVEPGELRRSEDLCGFARIALRNTPHAVARSCPRCRQGDTEGEHPLTTGHRVPSA